MSQYAATVKRLSPQELVPVEKPNYSCKANGCPNAGSMERGLCFFHWRADPPRWHEVTQEIRENFDSMRNWGKVSPELQAKHRAAAHKRFAHNGRRLGGLPLPEVA